MDTRYNDLNESMSLLRTGHFFFFICKRYKRQFKFYFRTVKRSSNNNITLINYFQFIRCIKKKKKN